MVHQPAFPSIWPGVPVTPAGSVWIPLYFYLSFYFYPLCLFLIQIKLVFFGSICFRGELGFLNRYGIGMCVVLAELFFIPFMLTCSMLRYLSLLLLGFVLVWCFWSCDRLWSVCQVVLVPYVDAVVAATGFRVLLFVLHVCMLKEYKGVMVTEILVRWPGEVWLG